MTGLIDNQDGCTVFVDGEQHSILADDFRYHKLAEVWEDMDLTDDEREEAFRSILGETYVNQLPEDFSEEDDGVYWNGRRLHGCLAQKVQSMVDSGLTDFGPLERFMEKLFKNPRKSSVDELYDFLSYEELPITPDGDFLAYKGVQNDFWSLTGNRDTIVLQGKTDNAGRLFNGIGETIEVERNSVDDNRDHHCSEGIHAGSLDYASSFGPKTVVVKINPADVVSVPTDYNCQKLRACKYKVVAAYSERLVAPVVKENEEKQVLQPVSVRQDTIDRIESYLDRKIDQGYREITVNQIKNSFGGGLTRPTSAEVFRALDNLGYSYNRFDNEGKSVVDLCN